MTRREEKRRQRLDMELERIVNASLERLRAQLMRLVTAYKAGD